MKTPENDVYSAPQSTGIQIVWGGQMLCASVQDVTLESMSEESYDWDI